MFFDLFFRLGPAIQAIFELGFEPKEELFYELTREQYAQLEKEGEDVSKRWFTLIPQNPKQDVPELLVIDEEGKAALLDALGYINALCEKSEAADRLVSFEDKLAYAAGVLPGVFSESSNYAKAHNKKAHLKVVT